MSEHTALKQEVKYKKKIILNKYAKREKEKERISVLKSENDHLIEFHLIESVDRKFLII